jgi:signal transduction histidine kinase
MREHELLHRQFRRMSDKYRAEVQKLQQFIDETTLGVVLVDNEGRITHLNEVSLQQFQNTSRSSSVIEMKGRMLTELFDPVRDWQCISMLKNALRGERSSLELVETEGQVLVSTAFSMRDNELIGPASITGAAIIMHDITELRQLRDELGRMDRLSLVGQMAASITHEIRNPMAVIRGFVQLMKERTGEAHHEYFRIIMDELDRANMIISDFLSLAQNRMIDKEFTSLNDIVTEIMPLIQADSNLRGLHVQWSPQPDLPKLWLNDKEMKQLILNLARNGLEAMKDDGSLLISTRSYSGKVELRVKDTGIGISQEQMDKLFEPFFTTKSRGTGLGLPVCLSIVEKHRGRIMVESKIGEGTTFIVKFCIEESLSEAAAAAGYKASSTG